MIKVPPVRECWPQNRQGLARIEPGRLGAPAASLRFQGNHDTSRKPAASWLKNGLLVFTALLGISPSLPAGAVSAKLGQNPVYRNLSDNLTPDPVSGPVPESEKTACEQLLQKRLKRYGLKLNAKDELSLEGAKLFFIGRTKKIAKCEAYIDTFLNQLTDKNAKIQNVSHETLLNQIYKINRNKDSEMTEYEVVQNALGPAALDYLEAEARRVNFKDMEALKKRLSEPFTASMDDLTFNLSLSPDYRDVRMMNAIHAAYNLAKAKEKADEKSEDSVTQFLLQIFTLNGNMPVFRKFDAKKNTIEIDQKYISARQYNAQGDGYTVISERLKYDVGTLAVIERKPVSEPEKYVIHELSLFKKDQGPLEAYIKPKVRDVLTSPKNKEHLTKLVQEIVGALEQVNTPTSDILLGKLRLQSLLSPIFEDLKASFGLSKNKLLIEDQNQDGDFMIFRCSDENIRLFLSPLLGQYNHQLNEGFTREELQASLSRQLVESLTHETTHALVMDLMNRYKADPKSFTEDPILAKFVPIFQDFELNSHRYNSAYSSRLIKNATYHTEQPLEKIAYTMGNMAGEIFQETYLTKPDPKKP